MAIGLISAVGAWLAACQAAREKPVSWTTGVVRSADGVAISYQVAGEGPVSIVFVHGWLCERSYWRHQLDEFARAHRVVALDLAGHGASGLDRDQWTFRSFGQDVAAVIDGLSLERTVLVGHSMGGPVILEAARIAPAQVTGLVVVDALQDPDAPGMTPEAIDAFLVPLRRTSRMPCDVW